MNTLKQQIRTRKYSKMYSINIYKEKHTRRTALA